MSATTLDRPSQLDAGGNGGVPARRAVARWAWRLFRREWRQQLLLLALITVAVTATTLGAAVATNTPPPANTGFGTANHLVTLPGSPHLAADLSAIEARFGRIDVIEDQPIATGLVQGARLRSQDPNGAYGRPMLALLSGHYPEGAGQVAMTRHLASTFGLHIGDSWHVGGRILQVVGLVENPQNLLDEFGLVALGQLEAASQVTVLFDATAATVAPFTFPDGAHALTPQRPNGFPPAVVVLAIAVVGLVFVGLVAVAGFTVLGQRRLRGLAMLSAVGATDRNVRLVMVANGAIVGLAGALAGAALGLVAWIVYVPHLATSANHRVVWTDVPWWLIGTAMVLAVVTATLASRRPARAVAETPVVAALSGRSAPAKGVHRSAAPGVVLLVLGPLLLAFSGGWGANGGRDILFQLGGLLACAAGLMLIAPFAVAVLGVNARRAPVAVRIALRDLARYRSRSGSALAATSFAVLIALLITLLAAGRFADGVDYFGPNLAANQLVLYAPDNGPEGGPGRVLPGARAGQAALTPAQLQAHARAIAAALGTHDLLALDSADVMLVKAVAHGTLGGPGVVYVATPAVLAHYGIDPRTIDRDTVLITSRPRLEGTPGLLLDIHGKGPIPDAQALKNPKIQTFTQLPTDASAPNLLVTESAIQRLKLDVRRGGWLIETPRPLTALQINNVRQMAAAAGTTIETKNQAPSLSELSNDATAAGILLALGVLAMTVGLIRSESVGDLRTLAATGATSGIRRTIAAVTAGALGLVGAVLGTAVAYLATVAFFRSQLSERMSHAPVLDLLLILVGLPVAAAAGGWLFAGREPSVIARQPLE